MKAAHRNQFRIYQANKKTQKSLSNTISAKWISYSLIVEHDREDLIFFRSSTDGVRNLIDGHEQTQNRDFFFSNRFKLMTGSNNRTKFGNLKITDFGSAQVAIPYTAEMREAAGE